MPPESQITSDSSDRESVFSFNEPKIKSRRDSESLKYECSIPGCKERFKRMDNLDRHEYYHTGIKKHACHHDGCDKVYSILTHLKRHLKVTHERTGPLPKNIPCELPACEKMFTSLNNMQRHIREVHECPKSYNCKHCGEKFTQKLKMRRHEISKHTGEYPFRCSKCSKGFYQERMRDKHTPTCKIYPCSNCGEKFHKWTLYLKHCKETQHGRKYYSCEHCSRVYSKPNDLQNHINGKHTAEEHKIVYECTVEGCQRSYTYERNLRQHMRTAHSGERFHCELCANSFSTSQNLLKHMERAHKSSLKRKQSDNEEESMMKIPKKPQRKKRKDAGEPKQSQLAKLSAVNVDPNIDKMLRVRDPEILSTVTEELAENLASGTDETSDVEHFSRILEVTKEAENSSDNGFNEIVELALSNT